MVFGSSSMLVLLWSTKDRFVSFPHAGGGLSLEPACSCSKDSPESAALPSTQPPPRPPLHYTPHTPITRLYHIICRYILGAVG
jgi:hypothetical protein